MLKRTLAFILLGNILVILTDASCEQNNRTYEEGESWYPILHPYGVWRCANCTCVSGEIKCEKEQCPPVTCEEPRIPRGGCCPVCEDFTNLPPTVTTDTNNETDKGRRGCSFQGKHYADGAIFTSNSTGISPTMESQCVNCNCLSGRVLCRLKTCDIPRNCRKIFRAKDDCCPKCAENSKALLGSSELQHSRNVTNHDCQSADEIHLNGSEWRPTIGRNCITCTCFNGEIDCNRVDCVTERHNCTPQKQSRGECCNRCLRNKKNNKKRNKSRNKKCKSRKKKNRKRGRKKNGRRSKGKKGRRKGKKRRKQRKQNNTSSAINDVSPPSTSTETQVTLPVIFKTLPGNPLPEEYFRRLCKPDDTNKVIYRQFIKHHGIFIAFDDLVSDQIEVLWWTLTKGKLSAMQKYRYSAAEFRQNITENDVLGAASNGEIRTFKRRLKKQMDNCLKRNKCRSRLIKRAFSCFEIEKVRPYCQTGSS